MADISNWIGAGAGLVGAVTGGRALVLAKAQSKSASVSADAAVKTAAAARDSAEAARVSAAAARQSVKVGQEQVYETYRARIDAIMPRITVRADERPAWPPVSNLFLLTPHCVGEDAEPLHLPKDGPLHIIVRSHIQIANESEHQVTVAVNGPWSDDDGESCADKRLLDRHKVASGWIDVDRTLGEWVEIYRERDATRAGGPSHIAYVSYRDDADCSAVDSWQVEIGGTPVEPVPQQEGAWRIAASPELSPSGNGVVAMGVVVRKERMYYISKERGERVPAIGS